MAYASLERPGISNDSRIPALPTEEPKQSRASSRVQGIEAGDIFHSLIATGTLPSRNPWATVGSLSFGLLFLAALVVVPLFHTEPLPKTERVTTLYLPPSMLYQQPPPGAKFHAPKPRSIDSPVRVAVRVPVIKAQEARPPASATSSVAAVVPDGAASGIPGGVSSAGMGPAPGLPVLPETTEAKPVKRIRVSSRVVEANLIHEVPPQYPQQAGRERIEGTVVLLALIGKDGTVKDVRVESGLPMLAQAAIDAVKQWRYKPYVIDGEPVEVDTRIPINFTLSAS